MIRILKFLLLTMLLTALAAAALVWDGRRQLRAPLAISEHRSFELQPGSRLRDAVLQMRRENLFTHVRQALYLEAWGRISGEAANIKAGEYSLDPGLSSLDLLSLWVGGKTVLHEVRIIEGMRFDQALKIVLEHPEILRTLADTRAETVMTALQRPGLHPEGRLFPDTYRFPKGTTDVALLKQSFDAMERIVQQTWAQRRPDLPYARTEDMVTMASIIEKETALASERERIAGVFVRRLQMGMRLQTDPTVIYGLGELFDGNLRKRDLLADGPYNTYARAGLPPTPICLPGRASLEAAVNPAAGTELFFVSRGDGSHQFSATLAEHEAAVRKYQLGGRGG
ncbi:endolytic transglycosylase MltG [Panacagrimonas sp.]|uniref:endolytic transglycosylase MltG n=1 Tax=Panacagrimonas sp. TaxID=2480088 RepID=UPI003B5173CB